MKMLKFIALSLLVIMTAGIAQAGFITPGLEGQLSTMRGDETVKVLVVMSAQADIDALNWQLHDSKANLEVRHHTVVQTLVDQSKNSQTSLLADLDANKANGAILGYTSHWIVNSVVVVGTVDAIRELATRSDVERIEADLVVELIEPVVSEKAVPAGTRGIGITPGVVAVGARRVWNELGIDGTGVIVSELDTGVDGNHVALQAQWRGNYAPVEECWLDAANLGHSTPQDSHGHGSHTMGTVMGQAADDTIGVAPGALWIASNIINSGTGVDFDNGVIASFEWLADPDGDPYTTDDVPAVCQNSWGVNEGFSGYYDCDSRWWDAIDNCEAAGVVVTWSAGNEGPGPTSLRSPADRADSPGNCFSVGSTQPFAPYEISSFSSRGPSGCGGEFAMKPEITAPGSDIYSVNAGGGYTTMSGTSMAGPHIAGVVALMRASNPNVDVITIKEVLMATAIDLGAAGEDNTYGHGFVDAYAAVLAVMGGIGTVEGVITDASTGMPIEGAVVSRVGGFNQDVTDENGYYRMTMPIDDVELAITKFGYNNGSIFTTILEDQTVVEDYALNLLPSATISGTVYGPNGATVAGAIIRATNTPLDAVTSDAAGFYSILLPSGAGQNYDMVARASGMGAQAQTVELLADMTLDFNLPEWIGDDFETGNFNRFPWEMVGADWTIDSANTYEGNYSAMSGNINDGQTTGLELTLEVQAAGEIKFWYKVSSESNYDFLHFMVDGTDVESWSGEIDWTEMVYTVQPGVRTFSFVYTKDGSVSNGDDAAWIDFMELPPVELPGTPDISVSSAPIEVTVDLEGNTSLLFPVGNIGDGLLSFSLNLAEVNEAQSATSNPVPFHAYGKNEQDDRAAVSPITGAGGPDAFGYTWMDSDEAGGPAYNWVDISGSGNVAGAGDDDNHGPFAIGFPFSYYGNSYETLNICTNGWVSFTSTSTNYSNQGIPDSGEPNNLIAPFWDDLNPNDGGTIYYLAEADRFIVQYQDVPHYSSGTPETFQVIFNADGSIVFQYETVQNPGGCTVGIENATGDDGLMVAFNDGGYLHDGLAIRLASVPPMTWFTADPMFGDVVEMTSLDVNLMFDAAGLETGVYQAIMSIYSNDIDTPQIDIPVVMTVGGTVGIDGDIDVDDNGIPTVITGMGSVHPNPFNPMTTINYSVARTQHVNLSVFNVMGQRIKTLVNETVSAGSYPVQWNGTDSSGRGVSSGTYFVRMSSEEGIYTNKLMLVR